MWFNKIWKSLIDAVLYPVRYFFPTKVAAANQETSGTNSATTSEIERAKVKTSSPKLDQQKDTVNPISKVEDVGVNYVKNTEDSTKSQPKENEILPYADRNVINSKVNINFPLAWNLSKKEVLLNDKIILFLEACKRKDNFAIDLFNSSAPDYQKLFLNYVNYPDNNGQTTLFHTCANGNKDLAKFLLEKGATLDKSDNNGQTPLFYACANGNKDLVKFLVTKKLATLDQLDQKDNNGQTPLFYACAHGHQDLAKFLIDNRARLDQKDNNGQTPLFYACKHNHAELSVMLIDQGAKINHKDEYGRTPLHIAAEQDSQKTVINLLQKNADPALKDQNNRTPIHAAYYGEKKNVVTAALIDHFNPSKKNEAIEDNKDGVVENWLLGFKKQQKDNKVFLENYLTKIIKRDTIHSSNSFVQRLKNMASPSKSRNF